MGGGKTTRTPCRSEVRPMVPGAAVRMVPGITVMGLVVRQPWASYIVDGRKTIEARRRGTRYRGPLVIVAAKRPRLNGLPSGVAVAVCRLDAVHEWDGEKHRAAAALSRSLEAEYRPRAAWVLTLVQQLDFDVPVSGRLGLFPVIMPRDAFPHCCPALGSSPVVLP